MNPGQPPSRREYDLSEILELMKQYKAVRVKLGGLEVELSPDAFDRPAGQPGVPGPIPEAAPGPGPDAMPTDEELLHWSTPWTAPSSRADQEPADPDADAQVQPEVQ